MQRNRVEICGVNTSQLRVLTDDEKRALLLRVRDGDERARNELISGNLRLVLSIVQRFSSRHENMDDLFQVGCIGLVKAVDNFNLELDVKFSTYTVPMIIGEIRRYLRDNNSIRISRSTRDLAYRALQAREELIAANEREPTVPEIAERLGEKKEAVLGAMEAIVEPISLYEPVYNDGGDALYLMDQLSDSTDGDAVWLENIVLRDAMKHLTPRERNIIQLRFWRNKTQMEIAGEIGISQAQVSRLEKAALEKMRRQQFSEREHQHICACGSESQDEREPHHAGGNQRQEQRSGNADPNVIDNTVDCEIVARHGISDQNRVQTLLPCKKSKKQSQKTADDVFSPGRPFCHKSDLLRQEGKQLGSRQVADAAEHQSTDRLDQAHCPKPQHHRQRDCKDVKYRCVHLCFGCQSFNSYVDFCKQTTNVGVHQIRNFAHRS